MLTKFWEKTGEGISGKWIDYLLGPAFLFWAGGILIVMFQKGFYNSWNWLASRDVPSQTAFLIIGLMIVAVSSKLMEQIRFNFLRLLEGYWVWPLSYLADLASRLQYKFIERDREHWNILMDKQENGKLSIVEKRKLARLEVKGHYAPVTLDDCMPTILGNVLRSAESLPQEKYGLDAVICWPRLWLLLSKDVQDALNGSRQNLDALVELWAWGLFFAAWTFLWGWSILISIAWMVIAYLLATQSARTFSDLLESTFDLYRWDLFASVHWTSPQKSGADEIALGKQLTQFLWRGTLGKPVNYEHPDQSE